MNLKRHNSLRARAAFTMIEIALALAVIGFALVAIIGVLPVGMNVQKDNREQTLVTFDANYLMDAIRSGTVGMDDLTNHIVNITNYTTLCDSNGIPAVTHINFFTTTNYVIDGSSNNVSVLTNGANIIGLLSIPKYILAPAALGQGFYYSNYTTADFRAITGSLSDQGMSQTARNFAFVYRVYIEVIPFASYQFAANDATWANFSSPGGAVTNLALTATDYAIPRNVQANLNQIRLRFRWPVLSTGSIGTSHLTFRSAAAGTITKASQPGIGDCYYLQPGTFVPSL